MAEAAPPRAVDAPVADGPVVAERVAPARAGAAVLTALAVALLAGGLVWVWSQQQQFAESADVAALREQLRSLQQRLAQVEQRPAASPAIDLRPLEARLAALEQRPPVVAQAGPDPGLAERLAALDQRVVQAERAAARTVRIALLQRAGAALAAGQATGPIAGAPPALARFAASPPPTEAALRLGYPAAAERARAASLADGAAPGIGDRIWHRVLGLVTVRAGETVLLGAPAVAILGHAGERLAAGDLAGAVLALDGLDAGAAGAIAAWRDAARSLLDAREALAALLASQQGG